MYLIQEVIIKKGVLQEKFVCNLEACKGACCVEGEYGAPLETEEMHKLEEIYPAIKPYLSPAGIAVLEKDGLFIWQDDIKEYGTPLLNGKDCAYLVYKNGIAECGIEHAWKEGVTDFKKPISCHLYPIRLTENKMSGFQIMQYDQWDICSEACKLGSQLNLPVFRFLKEAIIRKYDEGFYDQMEELWEREKKKTDS